MPFTYCYIMLILLIITLCGSPDCLAQADKCFCCRHKDSENIHRNLSDCKIVKGANDIYGHIICFDNEEEDTIKFPADEWELLKSGDENCTPCEERTLEEGPIRE